MLLSVACFGVLTVAAQPDVSLLETADPWARIQSLQKGGTPHGNPELVEYLKSLTPEDMLLGARQACAQAQAQPGDISATMRAAGASMSVALCLGYYLDGFENPEDGVRTVLSIVANPEESRLLRQAIIEQMSCSRFNKFVDGLQTYVLAHVDEVGTMLGKIVEDQGEDVLLRGPAMSALAAILREKVRSICQSDPGVRAASERTGKVVRVGKMVRSGELALSAETWEALRPVEARVLANAKLLGSRVASGEQEPETLRARARVVLRSYEGLPLTDDGRAEIERVLREAGK